MQPGTDSTPRIPILGSDAFDRFMSPVDAVEALERVLLEGLDVESDPPRLFSSLASGEFLLMPSETPRHAGVKVVTIAPGNAAVGLPRIHAWYLLFDAATLTPLGIVDGTRLTLVRTAGVTALAIRGLLRLDPHGARTGIAHLAVIGTGPQAEAHIRTLCAVMDVETVTLHGRHPEKISARLKHLADLDREIRPGRPRDLAAADVVVTATSSTLPVLDRGMIRADAVVGAIGSHGRANRELASDLMADADVVVEARSSALRENGNVLLTEQQTPWDSSTLRNLAELVLGDVRRRRGRPAVYTGVGMSWEDLALVAALTDAEAAESAVSPAARGPRQHR